MHAPKSILQQSDLAGMIICHSRKFIFVHIQKTGGTSIKQALDPYLAWNDLILGGSAFGESIQQSYAKRFGLNKHSSISEIEAICGKHIVQDYYIFALVRHPVARACSMYNYVATKLQQWAHQQNIDLADVARYATPKAAQKKPALQWASTKAFLRTKNFSEFLRNHELKKSHSFRPQLSWLTADGGKSLKAHFFRIEDSEAWTGELGRRLGIEFAFPRANESGTKVLSESAITVEDRAYIEEALRPDYEAFGYHP